VASSPQTSSNKLSHLAQREALRVLALALIGLALFLSGVSALIYQVAWQRMLGLFTGSDVRSVTIVVGAYLAGLGIGSLLGSLVADRLSSRRAMLLVGLCDLLIALFAFGSKLLFYDLLFVRMSGLAASLPAMLAVAFATLLPPTLLMGVSMPMLARAIVRGIGEAPRLISILYAVNTCGAAVGTLAAGWYLVGARGFDGAVYLGGQLSLAAALMAFVLLPLFRDDDRAGAQGRAKVGLRDAPREVWGWCALVCASGFIAISLEVLWFRALKVMLQPNAYTFAHMLFFILVSYAIGGWLGAWLIRRINSPTRAFLLVQSLAALYALGFVLLTHAWYDTYNQLMEDSHGQMLAPGGLLDADPLALLQLPANGYLWLPLLMLVPPNVLIGMGFPFAQKAVQTSPAAVGQRAGLVQMANVLGNVLGSLLTGTVLLDTLGTAGTLQLIGAIGTGFAVVLAARLVRLGKSHELPEWHELPGQGDVRGARGEAGLGETLGRSHELPEWHELPGQGDVRDERGEPGLEERRAAGAALKEGHQGEIQPQTPIRAIRAIRGWFPAAFGLALSLLAATVCFPSNHSLWARLHGGLDDEFLVAEDSTGLTVLRRFPDQTVMFVNGSSQGTLPFGEFHTFLGVLPALLHPAPQSAMVIGIGSAATPYGAGANPETQRILAVEIVGSELPVLRQFENEPAGAGVRAMLADPRYEIVVGDGRRELKISEERFDFIQADAIYPWRNGAGALYSREFFEEVRRRLKPGGMMVQWLPTGRTQATFLKAFPYVLRIDKAILIGSDQPIEFDKERLLARLDDPRVVAYLQQAGLDVERFRAGVRDAQVSIWTADRPRGEDFNTDLLPKDEYYLNNTR
jgi:predicted membrane-bound spermidine synthase